MASPISERIGALVGERTRLEALLADNTQWRALCIARAARARGEAAAEADVERLEQALAVHAIFRAREALDAAVRDLTLLAEAAPEAARHGPDALDDVIRPRPQVRIHAQPPAAATEGPASDLTRIRGIDNALAARLGALGVTCASEVASWTAADVARISAALGVGRRISSENWIEQAAVLAARDAPQSPARTPPAAPAAVAVPTPPTTPTPTPATAAIAVAPATTPTMSARVAATPAHRQAGETPASRAVVVALQRPAATRAAVVEQRSDTSLPSGDVTAAEPAARPDRLTLIRGLSDEMADWLRAAGVTRYAEIAAWTAGDLACYGAELGIGAAARREGWIEQAAVLASGRQTRHAARVLAGEWDALVPPPRAETKPDAELRARLIAASLLTAASSMMRFATLPLDQPEPGELEPSEEPAGAVADAAEPTAEAAAPDAADPSPASPGAIVALAAEREPAMKPLAEDTQLSRLPRLAEQIAPLKVASPARSAMPERETGAERKQGLLLPTLGSWSAPIAQDNTASTPIVAEWSEVVATASPIDIEPEPMIKARPTPAPLPTRQPSDEPRWPDIEAGEAEVIIHQLDDEAAIHRAKHADVPRPGNEGAERRRWSNRPRELRKEPVVAPSSAPEEASVEIYTHGEQPRTQSSLARRAAVAEESVIDAAAVRRFLKGLTGR